ncbi:NAD-dependent epimerase/dehydratase family protein [uncultured Methanobrevibacter sp.]|uniref:NAD-dependent epimerase/dehydratase family protein n=1 Tax=uncultured Methanobrevibacter sp. TaxID=253161 RepID=UPI0025FED6EE|nr:NAD-dependent epimerase/dehydratase family protein [uncultured Methanobrevibacter sp.]
MIINKIIDEDTEEIIQENNGLKELYGKSIMITGASGMIGSYFLYTLMKLNEDYCANIKIIPLVRNIDKLNIQIRRNEFVFPIIQDVTTKIEYDNDIDYIIHAASPASPKIMEKNPVETNFANTIGTANTLLLAKDKNVEGYLFISSREIYGKPLDNQEYFTEDSFGFIDQLIPRNAYAEGKKAAENMCVSFNQEYGVNTKIVRLAHTYGPRMSIYDGRVQADFLKNLINGENIILKSDGSSIRTYTYIADAINAMFKILLKSNEMVYNVSDEKNEVSIRQLAEIISNIPSQKLELIYDIEDEDKQCYAPFKFGILSSKKIRDELNWQAKYSVKEGFKRTYEYLKLI